MKQLKQGAPKTIVLGAPCQRLVLFAFLFFLDADNFAALVEAAVRANRVRWAHFTAIRAGHDSDRFQRVMGAAAVTSALGMLPFRVGGHV
jgi:hypothetical protein